MTIIWTSSLSTGIEVIDEQHMRIVEYINQLESAILKDDRNIVGDVLAELVDYTLSHFAFEESLQEEAGYEFAKPHKAVHELFVRRVEQYRKRHVEGEDIARELHGMLSTWLVHHIKRDDMAYVANVKANLTGKEQGWLGRTLGKFFR